MVPGINPSMISRTSLVAAEFDLSGTSQGREGHEEVVQLLLEHRADVTRTMVCVWISHGPN